MRSIKITANSKEEYSNIESDLNLLPDLVLNQIFHAENTLLGLTCYIGLYSDESIYIPSCILSLLEQEDRIVFYVKDFTFMLDKKLLDKKPLKIVFTYFDYKYEDFK